MQTRAAIASIALVGVSSSPCPASQSASAGTPTAPTANAIGTIEIQSSTWRQMQVDVGYELSGPPRRATIAARWMRKNGRALAFTPVSATIAPGARRVTLGTVYRGVLPPPNEIIMHVEMRGPSGAPLVQYDCDLALVNAAGKLAWGGDVAAGRPVRWKNRKCAKK
ncbi:MAG: hypothetical protein ABJD07_13930 [Gemmatimonadaceae bacterium]